MVTGEFLFTPSVVGKFGRGSQATLTIDCVYKADLDFRGDGIYLVEHGDFCNFR